MIYLVHVDYNTYYMSKASDASFTLYFYTALYPRGNVWLEVINPRKEPPE